MGLIPSGKELLDPFFLMQKALVSEGQMVADLGCGALGHFVFPAAELVGKDGKVYGVDILRSVLEGVESRAGLVGTTNVETVWSDLEVAGATKIPAASLDAALVINNLYQSKKKKELLTEARRLIKSGGTLLAVDWKPGATALGPKPSERVAPDLVKKIASELGFTLEEEFEAGPYHFGLRFKKQ